jgi:hypothetical protein
MLARVRDRVFDGRRIMFYRQKLDTLKSWREGESNANVLRWLDEYAAVVEGRMERAKIEEERKD